MDAYKVKNSITRRDAKRELVFPDVGKRSRAPSSECRLSEKKGARLEERERAPLPIESTEAHTHTHNTWQLLWRTMRAHANASVVALGVCRFFSLLGVEFEPGGDDLRGVHAVAVVGAVVAVVVTVHDGGPDDE